MFDNSLSPLARVGARGQLWLSESARRATGRDEPLLTWVIGPHEGGPLASAVRGADRALRSAVPNLTHLAKPTTFEVNNLRRPGQVYLCLDSAPKTSSFRLRAALCEAGVDFREVGETTRVYLGPGFELPLNLSASRCELYTGQTSSGGRPRLRPVRRALLAEGLSVATEYLMKANEERKVDFSRMQVAVVGEPEGEVNLALVFSDEDRGRLKGPRKSWSLDSCAAQIVPKRPGEFTVSVDPHTAPADGLDVFTSPPAQPSA